MQIFILIFFYFSENQKQDECQIRSPKIARPQRKKTLPIRFQDVKIDNKMKPDIITNPTKIKTQIPSKSTNNDVFTNEIIPETENEKNVDDESNCEEMMDQPAPISPEAPISSSTGATKPSEAFLQTISSGMI